MFSRIILPILSLTTLLIVSNLLYAETADLRLEGVAYDSKDPPASVAVINGDFYELNQAVEGYRIIDIQEKSVRLVHSDDGEERVLDVEAKPELETPESGEEEDQQGTFLSKMADGIQQFVDDPSSALGRVWELMAIRDLSVINNASVRYYENHEFFPRRLKQLTLDGLVGEAYGEGEKGKYRFYYDYNPHPDHMGIHADPIDPDSKLKFFFVGVDAVIRESRGKPANLDSPPHDY